MNLVSPEIEKYIEAHTTDESDVLQQLNRKTQTDVLMPQMLSGKVQGQFLKFISQMVQPERVLEIGTFTGYAAICLANCQINYYHRGYCVSGFVAAGFTRIVQWRN